MHLFALDSDPEVMRFINGGAATPRAVIENRILPVFLKYDEALPVHGFWAAEEKDSREFLGWFAFRPREEDPSDVAVGYRFRRASWGYGYATEGAQALIDRGFEEFGVARVSATTYEENRASIRVMEKLGMKLFRSFRITSKKLADADTFYTTSSEVWEGDDVEYSLDRAEWRRFATALAET